MHKESLEFGCWNIVSDIQVVNLLAKNLDFIIIDLEHGFRDFSDLNAAFFSARHFSKQIYVRVRKFDDPWIQSLLDIGVTNFVLPQIRTADELDIFIQATRFPPFGRRGLHPRLSQNSLNLDENGPSLIGESGIRICMIVETREALASMDQLMAREEIDEIYIGVYDLSLEFEIIAGVDSPEMLALCQKIANMANIYSKKMLAMATSEKATLELRKLGVAKFVLGIDSSLIIESIFSKMSKSREILGSING